jgi:hypothetical protein
MQLTPHFTLEEMAASDTAARLGIDNAPTTAIVTELRKTAELLERVRLMLGTPLLVTSGYRCLALNRAIGSADTSAHLAGRAADFRSPDSGTPFQICKLLAAAAAELDKLAGDYAAEVAGLQGELQDAQTALAKAEARKSCDRTPRSDAFDRGVRAGAGPGDRHPDATR